MRKYFFGLERPIKASVTFLDNRRKFVMELVFWAGVLWATIFIRGNIFGLDTKINPMFAPQVIESE